MRKTLILLTVGLLLGCGNDNSAKPDAFDASDEVSMELSNDDGTINDEVTVSEDDGGFNDDGVSEDVWVSDDAVSEILDAPPDEATSGDGTETCSPTWHPTNCGDCIGSLVGNTCNQSCNRCEDGREYLAECDGTTHTCHCSINGVEVCTCTSANPVGEMGCEPEEWGGANCCWIVG